jgi:hypothetical protein
MSSSTERPESPGQALDTRDGPASQGPEPDPWFEPAAGAAAAAEPSPAAAPAQGSTPEGGSDPAAAVAGQPADSEAEVAASEWFLRTGRAGLLPESMTEEPPELDTGDLPRTMPSDSAPPWATEPVEIADGLPPPWESGPWGPDSTGRAGRAGPQQEQPQAARPGFTATSAPQSGALAGRPPGGLRLGRRTSWVVAGALTAVAVVVVVIVAVGGGKSADPGCTDYQASGQASYTAVLADLNTHAPAGDLAAKLRVAIKRINLAAAQARQASVQAALAGLTSDMQTALADATSTPIPAQVQQSMRKDAKAAAAACRS